MLLMSQKKVIIVQELKYIVQLQALSMGGNEQEKREKEGKMGSGWKNL